VQGAGLLGLIVLFGLFILCAAHAGALLGAEYVPPGLGESAWVEGGQLSGTQVAERDGMLVPPLRTHGGWVFGRTGLLGGLSVARVATSVQTAESTSAESRSALRPAVSVRRWLMDPVSSTPLFFLTSGVHLVVPFVVSASDGASTEEESALDEAAEEDEDRIGGWGGQLGMGAEYRLENGISFGMKSTVEIHRSQKSNAQTRTVSVLVRPQTALTVGFWF
jgi:hypothetical protein